MSRIDADEMLNAEEFESWEMAIQAASDFDPPHELPTGPATTIPRRLVGCIVLIFLDDEWNLAKVDRSEAVAGYRYQLLDSWEYGVHLLRVEDHGRLNDRMTVLPGGF